MPYTVEQKVETSFNKLDMLPRAEPQVTGDTHSLYVERGTNELKFKNVADGVQRVILGVQYKPIEVDEQKGVVPTVINLPNPIYPQSGSLFYITDDFDITFNLGNTMSDGATYKFLFNNINTLGRIIIIDTGGLGLHGTFTGPNQQTYPFSNTNIVANRMTMGVGITKGDYIEITYYNGTFYYKGQILTASTVTLTV
jgi:hypothetical protein